MRIDTGARSQAFRALLALQDEGPNQARPHSVGDFAIFPISGVEFPKRLFGARQVPESQCAIQAARVRFLHEGIEVAVVVVDTRARGAQNARYGRERSVAVSRQKTPKFGLDSLYFPSSDVLELPLLKEVEDEPFFALGV